MIRLTPFVLLATGVLSAASAQQQLPVAPPPRVIRPDGSRDPAPAAQAAKKEDPLKVVERIIKNSQEVGDKLAMTDTGATTQDKQKKILQDIDALLKQDDPPPDKDKNDQKDKQDQKDNKDKQDKKDNEDKKDNKSEKNDKKEDMTPKAGMNDMPPPMGGGGGGGMDQQPMGGDQITERQPRKGGGKKQEPKDTEPKSSGGQKQQPMAGKQPPQDPKTGKTPDPTPGMPPPMQPLLPNEDEVVKDVWGHLPDKLRQEASRYYKQEFMPRYTELLKQYYSSLRDTQNK